MAAKLNKSNIEHLPTIAVQDFIPQIQTGNILFCDGEYFISNLIEKVTDSPWSHLGILINLEAIQRTLLLESVNGNGVRIVPLSKYTRHYEKDKPYDGTLVVAHVEGIGPKEIQGILQFGVDLLSLPYDDTELVKSIYRIIKGSGSKERDREFTCAELVYECFLSVGIEFPYDKRGFISPQNIWEDPRVSIIGRLEPELVKLSDS